MTEVAIPKKVSISWFDLLTFDLLTFDLLTFDLLTFDLLTFDLLTFDLLTFDLSNSRTSLASCSPVSKMIEQTLSPVMLQFRSALVVQTWMISVFATSSNSILHSWNVFYLNTLFMKLKHNSMVMLRKLPN
jgi:hypothetical protein